jgi:uncharacterized protein YyaL (SSP411 family)
MADRLAPATSAYLQSAVHQPVDWHQWGPEPFNRAAAEGKPVLLDIGAVWCHWCHVMDSESYEDQQVAEFLNRHFIAIKVDRDERPDVDARYQRAVQGLTGQGGWPLTAFLNAAGEVFFGGTYFPPDGSHGRPGFLSVLRRVVHVYQAEPERVAAQAAELRRFVTGHLDETAPGSLDRSSLASIADQIVAAADLPVGGFGREPKFPHPAAIGFLLGQWCARRDPAILEAVEAALDGMALGGFRDQVGGGFHRYSTDRRWIIPHFEKMASDNAELIRAYCSAARLLGRPLDREVVAETVRWVEEVLADPAGGYAASQDADQTPDDDGDYFTWTIAELDQVLDPIEVKAAIARYGIGTAGRMRHDPSRNVLFVSDSIEEVSERIGSTVVETRAILERALDKLRRARQARPTPTVDRTRYASWNAMVAAAMLDAGVLLENRNAISHGIRSLERLRREQLEVDRIHHGAGGGSGLLDDQVQVAAAALDAYEHTGESGWLDWAGSLMGRAVADLWDERDGGFFDRPVEPGASGLLVDRAKPIQDSPNSSPNGVAGIVLARLGQLTGDRKWTDRGGQLVAAFAARAPTLGPHGGSLLTAADWSLGEASLLVITGPAGDSLAAELHRLALDSALPRRVVVRLTERAAVAEVVAAAAVIDSTTRIAGYLCLGDRCLAPALTVPEWRDRMAEALAILGGPPNQSPPP